MNLYANEAACHVAWSVADKFSEREDMFFLLGISTAISARFHHFTDDITGNKMSQKEGEKTGILFIEVGVCGSIVTGMGTI